MSKHDLGSVIEILSGFGNLADVRFELQQLNDYKQALFTYANHKVGDQIALINQMYNNSTDNYRHHACMQIGAIFTIQSVMWRPAERHPHGRFTYLGLPKVEYHFLIDSPLRPVVSPHIPTPYTLHEFDIRRLQENENCDVIVHCEICNHDWPVESLISQRVWRDYRYQRVCPGCDQYDLTLIKAPEMNYASWISCPQLHF